MRSEALKKDGNVLLPDCKLATGFFARFLGLMGRRSIPENQALLFPKCNSIHTFFMRFPIDVVLVDKEGAVIEVVAAMAPWRLLLPRARARHVIEMRANRCRELGIGPGTKLQIQGVWT